MFDVIFANVQQRLAGCWTLSASSASKISERTFRDFKINWKGSGNKQYSPSMMLMLLIYCYATGRFSSRVIESATYSDLAVRYICGGDQHPDHDTICSFRRNNKALFSECFVKVFALAKELIPSFETVPKHIRTVSDLSTDIGYYGGDAVTEIEYENDLTAYVAVEKSSHNKTVQDLEEHKDPPEPDEDASITEKMGHRLKTKKGKERYKLRKQTVEPVFGTIKETIGFRHFHLRGVEKGNRLAWAPADLVSVEPRL